MRIAVDFEVGSVMGVVCAVENAVCLFKVCVVTNLKLRRSFVVQAEKLIESSEIGMVYVDVGF